MIEHTPNPDALRIPLVNLFEHLAEVRCGLSGDPVSGSVTARRKLNPKGLETATL